MGFKQQHDQTWVFFVFFFLSDPLGYFIKSRPQGQEWGGENY